MVPVELRFIDETIGHGVFSLEDVVKGTPLWSPSLVEKFTRDQVARKLIEMSPDAAHEYLRQSFVLATDPDHLCVNANDLGRYTNHSSTPNCGYADFTSQSDISVALRDIAAGEEITCDYSGLGSPPWYKELCAQYNVLPTDEVAKLAQCNL